ncbi:MAG TPA: formate dehydrogenase subunit gamma, partial [Rhizobiales bacterium]|nr:formate dehydrogenase subunit gamma [Hyphomicrobiales bacterium]
GQTISRFSLPQRTAHWFMAGVFIILGLTGLILLLGRTALAPLIGRNVYAVFASASMQGHNLFGPLFIIALIWMYYLFVPGNFFKLVDLKWIFKGGGLLGGHASAGHYNFGEKVWFWWVAVVGLLMSVTGIILEFPWLSANLQLLQISTIVHAIGAISLIAFALGHIYIGTIGMEGAIDSMTTGDVDINWAKEHHDLWYEDVTGEKISATGQSTVGHAQVYSQDKTAGS